MRNRRILLATMLILGVLAAWWWRSQQVSATDEPAPPSPATHAPAATSTRPVSKRATPLNLLPATVTPVASPQPGAFVGFVRSAGTGQPVQNAELTFSREGAAFSVRTSAVGQFRFDPPAVGNYQLSVITAKGHHPFAPEWGTSPLRLNSVAGNNLTGLVFWLEPEVEYRGRVLSSSGAPIPGAEIRLLASGQGQLKLIPIADRFTADSQGEFRFLAPEDALLEARHPGFVPAHARLDFRSHATRSITLRLRPVDDGGTHFVGLPLSGQVVDSDNRPVAAARVLAHRHGSELTLETSSDPDGRFSFSDLEPGDFQLVARHLTLGPASEDPVSAGRTDVKLRLSSGGRVEGVVRTQEGGPLPSFTIAVFEKTGPIERHLHRSMSFADPQGHFAMGALPSGELSVVALAHGYAPSPEASFSLRDGEVHRLELQLERGARVFGVVTDREKKTPIEGARILVEGAAYGAAAALSTVLTDAEGKFELQGLAAGRRGLTVTAPRHHGRVLSGLELTASAALGPLEISLNPVDDGEEPQLELVGIGAVLSAKDDALVVGQVIPGGGAAEAGLVGGDAILAVDGLAVVALGFEESIQRIRGPEGSLVNLELRGADGSVRRVRAIRRALRAP